MNNQQNFDVNNKNFDVNNKNDFRRKLIISILGLAIVLVAIVGISFAFYKTTIVTDSSSLEKGSVTISFTESNNYINIKNAIPVSDETGKNLDDNSFSFAITTTSESATRIPYTISVTTDDKNTLDDSYVRLCLEQDGKLVVSPVSVSELSTYIDRINSKVLYNTEDDFDNEGEKITHYKLKLWIDKSFEVSSDINKVYKLRVNVDSLM